MDLIFIFLAEKEEKIIKNREVVSCTSFIPTKFLSRGQLLIQEAKAINIKIVRLKNLRINLKLGVSAQLVNKTKEYYFFEYQPTCLQAQEVPLLAPAGQGTSNTCLLMDTSVT